MPAKWNRSATRGWPETALVQLRYATASSSVNLGFPISHRSETAIFRGSPHWTHLELSQPKTLCAQTDIMVWGVLLECPWEHSRLDSVTRPSLIRFGAFAADLGTREVRKHGIRLKLQQQPFEVLAALIERPGQVVTRDELRKRLWPDGVFVDYDRGLNKAVNRLRELLGDNADQPAFIETVPLRGYRFIAPVERDEPADPVRSWHRRPGRSPDSRVSRASRL
jgi:DNA-binding winged helix-turn-helix (wHTH) protein